jgi:hypothetical protein
MPDVTYEKDITGLLVIDPYNDFISEGGKGFANTALEINIPNYATAVVTTEDLVRAISR